MIVSDDSSCDFTAASQLPYTRLASSSHAPPSLSGKAGDERGREMRTRKRRLGMGVVLGAALAAAGVAVIAPTAVAQREPGKGKANDRPTVMRQLQRVNFIGSCRFSHRNTDDPIVFANTPGASHDHSFVGNRTTNAFSTVDSLLGGSTTCRRSGETAAYWMPTLYVDGNAVAPTGATIYYRRKTMQQVQATPPGFKMIAGDAKAAGAAAQAGDVLELRRDGRRAGVEHAPGVPRHEGLDVAAPRDVPGLLERRLARQPEPQAARRVPDERALPGRLQRRDPQISLIYRYPVTGQHSFELASGGVYSAHADFFNSWNQAELERLTQFCLNGLRHAATASCDSTSENPLRGYGRGGVAPGGDPSLSLARFAFRSGVRPLAA